ncbi:hypothetical protein GHT06_006313 [Daphnia sinensis]|uniref:Uncharacterized protein n=1 Tax=Daphnia sinensis TaxID=1820382 RepID=A0AAD5PKJ2_9CRUS|nr:hypothetical protein GHT06_006313 [Daphnia sinensis]
MLKKKQTNKIVKMKKAGKWRSKSPTEKYLKLLYSLKPVNETIQKPDGDFTYIFPALSYRLQGDAIFQNEYPCSNAKTVQMLSTNFIKTKQPQREVMEKGYGPPNKKYKRLAANAPSHINEHEVTAPRNIKQLRLSRDDLYDLYEMENSQKFIRHFVSFPDVVLVLYLDELWEKVQGFLNRTDIPNLCFSYDTTFKLGDVYVSNLMVRFQEMEQAPEIPVMSMLHERKIGESHD